MAHHQTTVKIQTADGLEDFPGLPWDDPPPPIPPLDPRVVQLLYGLPPPPTVYVPTPIETGPQAPATGPYTPVLPPNFDPAAGGLWDPTMGPMPVTIDGTAGGTQEQLSPVDPAYIASHINDYDHMMFGGPPDWGLGFTTPSHAPPVQNTPPATADLAAAMMNWTGSGSGVDPASTSPHINQPNIIGASTLTMSQNISPPSLIASMPHG